MKPTMNKNSEKRDIEELVDDEIITMEDIIKHMDEKDKLKEFRKSISVEQKEAIKRKTNSYQKRVMAQEADENRKQDYLKVMDELEER